MKEYFEGWFIPNKPLKKGEKFKINKMPLKDAEAIGSAYGAVRKGGKLKGKRYIYK